MPTPFKCQIVILLVVLLSSIAMGFSRFDLKQQFETQVKQYRSNNSGLKEMKMQHQEHACTMPQHDIIKNDTTLLHIKDISHYFPMNEQERQVFYKNGFVVSERYQSSTFFNIYERVFTSDLPGFISADSILHAWHRSFDAILQDTEEQVLQSAMIDMIHKLLQEMNKTVSAIPTMSDKFKQAAHLVDVFLCVARALLEPVPYYQTKHVKRFVVFRAETLPMVRQILNQIDQENKWYEWDMFGLHKEMNFATFKPRGHYTKSPLLSSYFRAVMWLSTFPFDLVSQTEVFETNLRAVNIMHGLLEMTGQMEMWRKVDQLLQALVGVSDSLTFAEWKQYSQHINDETFTSVITKLRSNFENETASAIFTKRFTKDDNRVVFNFLGQRFTIDSWIMNNVVFDRTVSKRKIPSSLDVMGALGNTHAFGYMMQRMKNGDVQSRDKLDYADEFIATKQILDKYQHWNSSIQLQWLQMIQELAKSPPVPKEWTVFQTCAWNDLALQSQMASWTQLRHDLILYQEPSATAQEGCEFPHVFIDPRESFWQKLNNAITGLKQAVEAFQADTTLLVQEPQDISGSSYQQLQHNYTPVLQKQQAFLQHFLETTTKLAHLTNKQNNKEQFTSDELFFAKSIVRVVYNNNAVCGHDPRTVSGWYIKLFYHEQDADEWDPIVADVHSWDDGVLFNAIGNVNLMTIAVPYNDTHSVVYAAPVYSHYEFTRTELGRMNDKEWSNMVFRDAIPANANGEWTRSFLVPKQRIKSRQN